MNKKSLNLALKFTASFAALSLLTAGAQAAECFDRDTSDPKAGNATAVIGPAVDVERENRSGGFRPVNGADMFTGDRVRTGDDSHLQLKLCDWSTYTFSPNSESAINEFFDAQGAGRRRLVNFFRGGMRFASGRDTQPGSTEVEIQESGVTMGVRGTNVILVELDGYVYALLEGPVRDNSGLTPKGLVDFWTDGNRDAITATLKRPGFAVRIGPDGVSEPFRADGDLLRRIYNAFVPVVPEDDGGVIEYAGDALDSSGQGAQEGDEYEEFAENRNEQEDENTENKPEQPSVDESMPPVVVQIGEILPLDVLEDFAANQTSPSGHILALASAQLFTDSGAGPVLTDEGVAIIQINIDWANRTVAPEAFASFVKTDLSLSDPNDLTAAKLTNGVPAEIDDAYIAALLASAGVPFADGQQSVAVFPGDLFTFTLRQGAGSTTTADVDVDFSATTGQMVVYNITAVATDIAVNDGPGPLAYFDANLAGAYSLADLAMNMSTGTSTMTGSSRLVFSTLGTPTKLNGIAVAQIEVDFDNRVVGGDNSYIAITAAADPSIGGVSTTQFLAFNQTAPFSSGLFNIALYPLQSLTTDTNLIAGQTFFGPGDGLAGDVAAIIADDSGNHLYTEVDILQQFRTSVSLATIADLTAQGQGAFQFGGYFYEGRNSAGYGGFSELVTAGGQLAFGDAQALIDINFANRTIGGNGSFVSVDITGAATLSFNEALNAVSFDDAASGVGVFGFDTGDFSGSNVDAALVIISDDNGATGAGAEADLYFNFNDGAGGTGQAEITQMPLTPEG